MNKKALVLIIGLVLSLSSINIVTATVNVSVQGNSIQMNSVVSSNDPDYDLVIIAPEKYASALQPLVDHKINVAGLSTILVTTSEIYDGDHFPVQGRDKPEKVKYFIKNAHEKWGAMYFLFVGIDIPLHRDVPTRYVYNQDVWGKPSDEPHFLSDLYYADLYDQYGNFSSWDTDGDGIFGEWYMYEPADDYDIDLYPDVYVGRLPCKNVNQVKTVVNKIITYETNTYGKDWFKNIIGVAGDCYPNGTWHPHGNEFPTPGFEGEETITKVFENMSAIGFDPTTVFVSDGTFTGPKDIRSELNKGAGLMFMLGHACPALWVCKDEDANTVKGISILDLTAYLFSNGDKLPVAVWAGCHNFEFDVGPWQILSNPNWKLQTTWVWECVAWAVTRLPYGGFIAAIGTTGLGLTKEDRHDCWEEDPNDLPTGGCSDFMYPSFFHNYINDGGTNTGSDVLLGEMLAHTISDYLDEYPIDWNRYATNDSADDAKTCEQIVLLGDPSLKVGGYDVGSGSSELEVANVNVQNVGVSTFENVGNTQSQPLSAPDTPVGPSSGEPGAEYTFTAHITGSDTQDYTCYVFDWGGDEIYSDPVGPLESDQTAEAKYTWNEPGEYEVRVKAWLLDTTNNVVEEADWSAPLVINIGDGTSNEQSFQQSTSPLFFQILERLANLIR